jgi:anti-sigma factor RsiW
MSTHLTSQQFAEAVLSEETPAHLRECPACRAELAELRTTLGEFRDATHRWSEKPQPVRRRVASYRPRALAAAALVLLAIAGGITYAGKSHTPDPTDTALLERVNADVSRTVPGGLEPLTVPGYR